MKDAPAYTITLEMQEALGVERYVVRNSAGIRVGTTSTKAQAKAFIADRELMARAFGPKK